ncbi:Uncharacterized conserved protein, DUF305 family [Actinomadura madurae]|uniref:Uncharacterized conserved protein, DUF305 family n=1 Tax=Actinomadura madurae TaxID=1993 RepID=A0A1I5GSI7_9ACTN|nr:DUF305 domain-containing protein [Actinomadura madurae]SFO38816.1 Uncharacterized conserved protein, DUF305 family [Actinomadura madurae]
MKRAFALAVVPALAIALAACGDDKDSGGSSPDHSMSGHSMSASPSGSQAGRHNDQDVTFARMMIPHHRQAIEMADLATARASSPEVEKLAAEIKNAQGPEIKKMTGWLTAWGASPEMGGMNHGGMHGMMTEKDMKDLKAAKGKPFDTAFLDMMIEHHQGAVAMARTEQSSGRSPEAKQMAADIISSQTAEIEKMKTLLKKV